MTRPIYKFMTTINLGVVDSGIEQLLPHASDVRLMSLDYDDLACCTRDCVKLMSELATRLNARNPGTKFGLTVEKAQLPGEPPPFSADWPDNAIAKIWLHDQLATGPHVSAISQSVVLYDQNPVSLN
jgi:hypothetical protein